MLFRSNLAQGKSDYGNDVGIKKRSCTENNILSNWIFVVCIVGIHQAVEIMFMGWAWNKMVQS